MNWYRQFHVYLLIGLSLAMPACKDRKKAPIGVALKEETRDDSFCGAFPDLAFEGGRLYVGTIESVTVTEREEAGFAVVWERGKITVRVQRALRGPAVKQLHLRYFFADYDPNEPNAIILTTGDDWAQGPWQRRPCVGEQILLLLILPPSYRAEQSWEEHTWVKHVWVGVGPDHPLVRDFEVAMRYLETRDQAERRSCFRKLCRSAWPTIRNFASDVATYGPYGIIAKSKAGDEDWTSKSRLMVEYVKAAGPLLTDWERVDLTRTLRFALCSGYGPIENRPFADWVSRHARDAAAEWLAVFEDWYLAELGADAMRPKPERSERALIELRTLVHHYGVEDTAAFFPKHGLAGLEKRLNKCAKSPDPDLAKNAKQLLDTLHADKK